MANFCLNRDTAQQFAQRVIKNFNKEQKEKYDVEGHKEEVIAVLAEAASFYVHMFTEGLSDEKLEEAVDNMLNDPEGFIDFLEKKALVKEFSKEAYEKAKESQKFLTDTMKFSRLNARTYARSETDKLNTFMECLQEYEKMGVLKIAGSSKDVEGKTTVSFMLLDLKEVEKTEQERVLDELERIQGLAPDAFPIEIELTNGKGHTFFLKKTTGSNGKPYFPTQEWLDKGYTRTGRSKYIYNGEVITTSTVTGATVYTGPVAAGPIGDRVDIVGRLFFDRKVVEIEKEGKLRYIKTTDAVPDGWKKTGDTRTNSLWDSEGNLRIDLNKQEDVDNLRKIIREELGNIFTVQGLVNLLKDFQQLEEQLKDKFHDENLQFFSEDIKLFGKPLDSNRDWTIGKPDLLVIDSRGRIHVLDFKTMFMRTTKDDYVRFPEDKKYYGEQVSKYIAMLRSYGFDVDDEPMVVQIDTYYDSTDTYAERQQKGYKYDEKTGRVYDEGGTDITGQSNDSFILSKEGGKRNISIVEGGDIITLGEYAERHGNPSREDAVNHDREEVITYMEPRLHVKRDKETEGFSQELAALRGREDIPYTEYSYANQYDKLSADEKAEIRWISNSPVLFMNPPQSITTLGSNDIFSRPDLISEQEVQAVADGIMYRVSRIISNIQKGIEVEGIDGNGLKGLSRATIVKRIGIDNLIDNAMTMLVHYEDFPTEEEYRADNYDKDDYEFSSDEDYQQQKRHNEKAAWLLDKNHREQLIQIGANRLMTLESYIVIRKNKTSGNAPTGRLSSTEAAVEDQGDNDSFEAFIDKYLEGISSMEDWIIEARNRSNRSSLAKEIIRMFENIELKDEKGNTLMDSYGWGFMQHLNPTKAMQTILGAVRHCETIEEMEDIISSLSQSPQNAWMQQVLSTIQAPGNENLRKKFFRNFRKDALTYSVASYKFDKETGNKVVETRVVNMKSAYDVLVQSLGAHFRNSSVGNIMIGREHLSLVSLEGSKTILTRYGKTTVAMLLQSYVSNLREQISKQYTPAFKHMAGTEGKTAKETKKAFMIERLTKDETFECLWDNQKRTCAEAISLLLGAIGLDVSSEVVADYISLRVTGENRNNANDLLNDIDTVLNKLIEQAHDKGIPAGLAGNSAGRGYFPLAEKLSNSVQENIEASVYQDGKTYYSYTNPSRIGHIIRNLKDSMDDPENFEKYIYENFGRYTGWFRDVKDERWLNDWIRQFTGGNGKKARNALAHKVELTYLGNPYKNLGALNFQLSVLHNYFGSRSDNETNVDWRWFALPTMSNKPTNEFVRMLKYKNPTEIIDRVLMPTFEQETNRIADVLFHFTHSNTPVDKMDITVRNLKKAGWTEEDIAGFRTRIDTGRITADDLTRLSGITSGAKFHFLWYLNSELAKNKELADKAAERINLLLTKDSERKDENISLTIETTKLVKEAIKRNMDDVVKNELEEMRKIGLFDEEEVKDASGKTVKILKYQEEFNGRLGKNNDKKEMEEALTDFIWQDIAANINIIQLTGGDLAYYGDAVNYQKRIAQIHSPGTKLMHDEEYDDGFLRSIHISDTKVTEEIRQNVESALLKYLDDNKGSMTKAEIDDYRKMISIIISGLAKTDATDGQSYSSPTSMRKKLALQGEWDDEREAAYKRIASGHFNTNDLGIMLQPTKPFVTSDMAKYSGSTAMKARKVPLQDKNSEYLIILAEAIMQGAGMQSKLVGICKFMEATAKLGNGRQGIDTVHFESVNKVGKSGVIDLGAFDMEFQRRLKDPNAKNKEGNRLAEKDYTDELVEYLFKHVRTYAMSGEKVQSQQDFKGAESLVKEGILKREEALYNFNYVDTIPLDDYIIQQNVPIHRFEDQQLYGSQIRILGISDITPSTPDNPTMFDVNGEKITGEQLIDEYKSLHAENIYAAYDELLEELGLDKIEKARQELVPQTFEQFVEDKGYLTDTREQRRVAHIAYNEYRIRSSFDSVSKIPSQERNTLFKNLEFLLQKELAKDAKYDFDTKRACTLQYDDEGNVIDFTVPLMDPIQSKRIQMLINSIIKKKINKQKINGGSVVQTTAFDKNLHIRFKHKNGGFLDTRDEYAEKMRRHPANEGKEITEELINAQYKRYVDTSQNGIAYFECYAPVPNAYFEKLITKEDGTYMSIEEIKEKAPKVWESMSQVIGYRIPTEDKYSMIPLKIVGFVPKAAGQVIMMPQEITYLTGSDFDIDKMYLMIKDFEHRQEPVTRDTVKFIVKEYLKTLPKGVDVASIEECAAQVIANGARILGDTETLYSWRTGTSQFDKDSATHFIEWYKGYILGIALYEYNLSESKDLKGRRATSARNNRILNLQWAVLTNADTLSKILNPGNFNEQKKTGRFIRIIKSGVLNKATGKAWKWDELSKEYDKVLSKSGIKGALEFLDNLLENSNAHNTTLPSSKIYFQHQNMQGSQMVGIFANHNVSHAFCSFQRIGIDLTKGGEDLSFVFDGHLIGAIDNRNEIAVLDRQKGFNGQLISKTIASFLAASVDTAKDPVLSDLNVNTFTGGVAMMLARLGYDTEAIGLFLSQPIIIELSEMYFRNNTDGYYDGSVAASELAQKYGMKKEDLITSDGIQDEGVLDKEHFTSHLNDNSSDDYQKRILKCFYRLHAMSKDLNNLTFCTKFNSVNNAVGPTIADTEEDLGKVKAFIDSASTNCFYEPLEDEDDFTSATEVIENDPILAAFFSTTVSDSETAVKGVSTGASKAIFRHFFPHYYRGFQNVLRYFKDNFTTNGRIPSKLYNQLLDEYLYYLLTYDNGEQFKPTIPYSRKHQEHLVENLVREFNAVRKIKGMKPNMLLDSVLGGNCLRVREADDYLSKDTLVFNGSQLDAEGQQAVKNAWSDLITMRELPDKKDNERVRRFAVDLFFYTLMRNGFGFSPKTLMHLASVIVRYNANYDDLRFNSYIDGLRSIEDVDNYLMGGLPTNSETSIRRFCNQFIRNHVNNNQLVRNISQQDKTMSSIIEKDRSGEPVVTGVEFAADDESGLYRIMTSKKKPRQFIKVTRKIGLNKLTQELYELESVGGSPTFVEEGKTKVRYRKVTKLGLTSNFIEYNANEDLEESYFADISDGSDASLEEEEQTRQVESRQTGSQEENDEEAISVAIPDKRWNPIRDVIKKTYQQLSKSDSSVRNPFNTVEMRKAGNAFIDALDHPEDNGMQEAWKRFKEKLDKTVQKAIDDKIEEENACKFNK